jgi:tryptophan synthase alpha chain
MMFIPYVCCGDPDLKFTHDLIAVLSKHAYAIELGIPFSDPIADGKTIQNASQRALKNNVNLKKIFTMIKKLRKKINTPLIFMSYFNIIHHYGCNRFLKKMHELNVEGLIVPDLPFGEEKEFEKTAIKKKVQLIPLIAPNTPLKRTKKILSAKNSLFTYLISSAGTTGTKNKIDKNSISFIKKVRKLAGKEKNLCVGFGISNPTQAKKYIRAGANGIIIGSKLIEIYSKKKCKKNALKEIESFANKF